MNCNRNQLNITRGSDVILNVTLEHEGEVIIPALIDGLEANLISGLGARIPLTATQAADYIVVNIPWSVVQRVSIYSLEVKGSINGLAWAAIGKGLIRYTNATEAGVESVTVEADAYDVTMEAGYHYSDSPIAAVHVSVDDEYGTPSADVTYQHKVLGLDFHNLRGNGITEIDVDEQEGDEAVNTATFKTDLDPVGTKFRIRNGSKGNGIVSSREIMSDVDGGVNRHIFTDSNGDEHVFHSVNGQTGKQGDSVLVGQGDLPLSHVLGQSNAKAMSQKGVTDEILKTPTIRDAQSEADLDIADAEGNVLVRMSGGHIKTKYFDSESVVLPSGNSIGNSDLDITDEQGNVLLRLGAGHVKTKYFDSSDIKTDIFKRTNFVGSPSLYLPDYDSENPVLFDNSSEVYAAYDSLAEQYPQYFAAKGAIGMDESGTYDVNLYQLGWQNRKITNQRDGSGTNTYSETTQKPTRLLVCAGTHPNETPSIYGCWWGIKSILESNEPWAVWIKSNLILDIVPLMQPWGLNNGHVQNNVNNVNINRTYYTDRQQENINMINLIADLMGKGLKGVIDCHNTGNSDNDGYLVSKPSYPYWYWYTELAQNISAMTNPLFEAVFGTTKNHFHCWDSSEFDGQLHDYVNSLGLLGCTFEIRKWLYDGTSNPKPIVAQLTRAILINIINAFATFNDKR